MMKFQVVLYLSIATFSALISCKEKKPTTILKGTGAIKQYNKGDIIRPFQDIDPAQPVNVTIKISAEDLAGVSGQIPKFNFFKTNNKNVIQRVRNWNFRYTGGDMATVSSSLKIFQNDKEIFSTGIVLDTNGVGLQSEYYGWIEAIDSTDIFETLKLFEY